MAIFLSFQQKALLLRPDWQPRLYAPWKHDYEKTNTTRVDKNGKESILTYEKLSYKDAMSLVDISLETGRSHQIRVQFSSRNMPLYGDQRYNKDAKAGEQIALFAYYLSFEHPVTKDTMTFSLELPNRYPFSLYK